MQNIAKEHALPLAPQGLSFTYLVKTSLSVQDHERHLVGIVADFLKEHADETIPPGPLCRTLKSEIRRRNDRETVSSNFDDLARNKGISRYVLQHMLSSIPSQLQMNDLAETIRLHLALEKGNIHDQLRINEEVRNYIAKRLDETNTVICDARRQINNIITKLPKATLSSAKPIECVISAVTATQTDEFQAVCSRYSNHFLQAMVAVAIYEQPQLPTTGPQP